MGPVGMVLDLVAEFVMGRVCYGPRCIGIVTASPGFYTNALFRARVLFTVSCQRLN